MEEALIIERLKDVDKELHSIMDELEPKKSKPKKSELSLEELRELVSKDVKLDIDPTKLIRQMRDREYDL